MDDCSGRSPDLRVDAPFRLPRLEKKPSGILDESSPLTVAGAVAELASCLEAGPHSHVSLIPRPANLNACIIRIKFAMSMQPPRGSGDRGGTDSRKWAASAHAITMNHRRVAQLTQMSILRAQEAARLDSSLMFISVSRAVVPARAIQGNTVRPPRCGQCRGGPRNCKRRACDHLCHWDRQILGRWSKAVTREPGDLLPAIVTRERVGRGAPKRRSSLVVCRIKGERQMVATGACDGSFIRRRTCHVYFPNPQSSCAVAPARVHGFLDKAKLAAWHGVAASAPHNACVRAAAGHARARGGVAAEAAKRHACGQ